MGLSCVDWQRLEFSDIGSADGNNYAVLQFAVQTLAGLEFIRKKIEEAFRCLELLR